MKVMITGAGKVGAAIAETLGKSGATITILEPDADTVIRGAGLRNVEWHEASGTDVESLENAGAREADVAVAATDIDEVNLVFCLLAKMEFGVPRVIARVNDPHNEWLFNKAWGVDAAVTHSTLISAFVQESVSVGELVRLLNLEQGKVRLIEVRLAEDSPALDRTAGDLNLPRDVALVAYLRDDRVHRVKDDSVFSAGDEVIALCTATAEEQARAALANMPEETSTSR